MNRGYLINIPILLIIFTLAVCYSFNDIGKQKVINQCRTHGSYKINEKEILICMVKTPIQENQGELHYLRPEGKKIMVKVDK